MTSKFVYIGIEAALTLVCVILGVILSRRRNTQAIKSRSPVLLIISHWALYGQTTTMLFALFFSEHYDKKNEPLENLYQVLVVFLNFTYYFALVLRCYRLYVIFKLDCNLENQKFFKKYLHRTKQRWLLKVLGIMMLPVVVLSVLVFALTEFDLPVSYNGSEQSATKDAIYVFYTFLEELLLVLAVFSLRNIEDTYRMTGELLLITMVWFTNSFFGVLTVKIWQNTIVVRNVLILGISTGIPIMKSYKGEEWESSLTVEGLQNLEIVLSNKLSLEYFENFICKQKDTTGEVVLSNWIRCEMYKNNYSEELSEEIQSEILGISDKIDLEDSFINLQEGVNLTTVTRLQGHLFGILLVNYFSSFKKSRFYELLLREVHKKDIYLNRAAQTSFMVPGDYKPLSNLRTEIN